MRIIAGQLKGHAFLSPPGNLTHPMSDKIRGALFNVLGDIEGLTFLDAFAGSGAVSFEALSRGAAKGVAIDADLKAFKIILDNSRQLRLDKDRLQVVHANCFTWSGLHPDQLFDIVVVDPPYELKRLNHRHVFKMLDHVRPDGLFVASLPPHDQMADYYARQQPDLEEVVRKSFGDAQLVFYRKLA